jgi:hypothetical protein
VGTSTKTRFELRRERPVLVRLADIDIIDDEEGKPAGVNQYIGRRPLAVFGNSDADLPMLQWAAAGEGLRLMMIIHHTDADREFAYDRQSGVGRLDRGLSIARKEGWIVADMERDWNSVFARPA